MYIGESIMSKKVLITNTNDLFSRWIVHIIFRFTLPQKIINKCIKPNSEKDLSRDYMIDSITAYYFSEPPDLGFQNGRPLKPANIEKIINDYLDKRSLGIQLPPKVQKDDDSAQEALTTILESCDNSELLGLHLWKMYRMGEKDPESTYKNLLLYLIIDGRLIEIITKEIAALRSKAEQLDKKEDAFQKRQDELKQRNQEILSLKQEIEEIKRKLTFRPVQVIEPTDSVKVSRIKSENRELSTRITNLKKEIETLKEQNVNASKTEERAGDLDSRINKARTLLSKAFESIARAKSKIKPIKDDILGLDKAIEIKEAVTIKRSKPLLDFFIDSYDLYSNTSPGLWIDFNLLKQWINSFFPEHQINLLTVLVGLSDRKGALIRNAKTAGFNVEFTQRNSWVSSISCRLMESDADTICFMSSNPQFSGLSRAFNRRGKKFFFSFPKDKMPPDLHGVGFLPIEEVNYTRRRDASY